jgi:hypothetical protein
MSSTDQELTEVPVLEAWIRMCCETPEFIANYNRLNGTGLRFTLPPRAPLDMMVDQACGRIPGFGNDPEQERKFFADCAELLLHLPELDDPRCFRASPAIRSADHLEG